MAQKPFEKFFGVWKVEYENDTTITYLDQLPMRKLQEIVKASPPFLFAAYLPFYPHDTCGFGKILFPTNLCTCHRCSVPVFLGTMCKSCLQVVCKGCIPKHVCSFPAFAAEEV